MTDTREQIQYLHTLSQISRSCLDELTKENQKLKKEIQQHIKAREASPRRHAVVSTRTKKRKWKTEKEIQQLREESKARDDTLSCLHVITKENERLKKENERHEKVMEIIDGAINSPLPRAHPEAPPHQ